ncbi:MAG TPA: VCBS repeat-containing protein [Planctomycetota bacterium]|nr:VCBS repeat-containing protein [Planctomycetota bacterium]
MSAAFALALALQAPTFETRTLEAGPRAEAVVARDLDADGHVDLLVQSGRDLQVFRSRGGSLPAKPDQVLRLDPAAFLWTLGRLPGEARPTLLTQGTRGIQAHRGEGPGFGPGRDLVVHPTLFEGPPSDAKPPLRQEFAPDLDRDGLSDILLYRRDAIYIMKVQADGTAACLQKLPIPVDVTTIVPWQPHLSIAERSAVPVLAVGDMTGDGRIDLGVYREDAVGIFRQGEDGLFTGGDDHAFNSDRRKRRGPRYFQFDLPPWIADFNHDGLLDLALIFPSKGRVQVYYGRAGRADYSQPDDIMRVADGWSTGVYIDDLDGDGRLDLIMGVVRKFGITEGIQVFLSGRVDMELHIYPCGADGRFARDPVQELKFSIPFSFQVSRESATLDLVFRPNFQGDFDGDGRRDMLVLADARTLQIYRGVKDQLVGKEPTGAITIDPPDGTLLTEPFVADLNGDGVSDLLLKHKLPERHVLELKLSRK